MDQFYTKTEISEKLIDTLKEKYPFSSFDKILEPSAGTGSFFSQLPKNKRIGVDLDPKCKGVKTLDFFDYVPIPDVKYLSVGNPPFGKNSSLAIKFFNRCATFSQVIAFVIPRTFKRVSVQNQLDLNFHLVYNEDMPMKPCCFTPTMGAKCCFQIWEKRDEKRNKVVMDKTHTDFSFLKFTNNDGVLVPPEEADFAMKAYGSNCGEIVTENLSTLSPKSWHWIKSEIDLELLITRFNELDYSISKDTVRQDSIGQQEVIKLYVDSLSS